MDDSPTNAQATWEGASRRADWTRPWTTLRIADAPFDRWFVDGELNVSSNCLDRHLPVRSSRPAIHWEGEPGDRMTITYGELHTRVETLTRALRAAGLAQGDRVALHLAWLPETASIMLACARIGAIYSVIPTPLPVEALAERIRDFEPRFLFTQDGAWRRGSILPLKSRVDEALAAVPGVELTIVIRRTGQDVAWFEGDRWFHDLTTDSRPGAQQEDSSPASLPAEHPLYVEALANRRGDPVSITHGSARLLLMSAMIHRSSAGQDGPTWIAGDAPWIAAQSSGILGPLFWGGETVLFEGALDTPDHGRAWDIVQRYGVESWLMSPSTARLLRDWTASTTRVPGVTSLRHVATIGERADKAVLRWFADDVGQGRIEVADGWGQVQLGGVVRFDRPVAPDGLPDPGLVIVDVDGASVGPATKGEVVLTSPWAGTVIGVHGAEAQQVIDEHWNRFPGRYATGDQAAYDADGNIEFLGRLDEVVSVSGYLVSLTEIREALESHPYVHAADVFEVRHPAAPPSILAVVTLDREMSAVGPVETVTRGLLDDLRETLGGLARPRRILVLDRFGDELSRRQRREAIAAIAIASTQSGASDLLAWTQVVATAGVDRT